MKYAFHPEALIEYSEAVRYYAQQDKSLAQAYINAIEQSIYHIREFPNRYPFVDTEIRRCLVSRFPYGILYTNEPEFILILAVMHCKRKPGYWQSRL